MLRTFMAHWKSRAAKTALLLDSTQLGNSQVQVSSAAGLDELSGSHSDKDHGAHDGHDISQEDKPRSRIVAEYLAHGYTISDTAIQRAIALDKQHGVSTRFTTALTQFDSKFKATDKAKGLDNSYGITEKATTGWRGLTSYFEKALGTPTGQRLATFYTKTDKQVRDIHTEARRLADLKSGKPGAAEHENKVEQVPGTDKTKCQCAGSSGTCPCEAEKCACAGCGKNFDERKGEKSATGAADELAASSTVAPLGEKTL